MDFEIARALRSELADRNLASSNQEMFRGLPVFHFDLNQGQLYALQEPESVMEVIKAAAQHAESEGYGEHHALLQLVARRTDFGKETTCIYWHRPYHVGATGASHIWISLENWLAEKGLKYVSQHTR